MKVGRSGERKGGDRDGNVKPKEEREEERRKGINHRKKKKEGQGKAHAETRSLPSYLHPLMPNQSRKDLRKRRRKRGKWQGGKAHEDGGGEGEEGEAAVAAVEVEE